MTPHPSSKELLHAYRHLQQHLLHAVQFSKPARYVVRDHLRSAFRSSSPEHFNPARISKTLEFLRNAAREKGIEHKILKNLVHVFWERKRLSTLSVRGEDLPFRQQAHVQFDRTVEKLNESMGLCI